MRLVFIERPVVKRNACICLRWFKFEDEDSMRLVRVCLVKGWVKLVGRILVRGKDEK